MIESDSHFPIPYYLSNTPPNSFRDSTTSPKVTTKEGKGVGERSLARNTSRVKGHVKDSGCD